MARTSVIFYKDDAGTAPAYKAIRDLLRRGKRKEFAKCQIRIGRLSEMGHELRRPEAAYLITKEGKVPDQAIDLAIRRKALFEADPDGRTFRT